MPDSLLIHLPVFMKYILHVLQLIFLSSLCQAQKIEIGVNGGVSLNSAFSIRPLYAFQTQILMPEAFQPITSVSFNFDRESWQYGMSAGRGILEDRFHRDAATIPWFIQNEYSGSSIAHVGNTRLFLNRKISRRRVVVYTGVSAGGLISSYKSVENKQMFEEDIYTKKFKVDYVLGAQVGVTWYVSERLSRHLGFNTELAGYYDHLKIPPGRDNPKAHVFYFPLTLGIRYRIFTRYVFH